MLNKWFFATLILGLLASCSTSVSSGPTEFVGFSEPRASYHFDSDDQAWEIFTSPDEQALFWINTGVLEGAVVPERGYIWSLNNERYGNVAVQAVIQQTRGSPGNGFGLMCRADDAGNGYYFIISSAGRFAIFKVDLSQSADLIPLVDWQTSPALQRGFEANTLQAVCVNDYLSFSANNQFLAEIHDKTFSAGRLGVVLGAVGETAWVSFDDIIVRDAMLMR